MSSTRPALSLTAMFAEREARRRKEREEEEQLQRRQEEELASFKKRLDEFELTQDRIDAALARIRRAFERGDSELMLASFPSSFCSDDGRAVNNAGAPQINRKKNESAAESVPEWINTMPKGAALVYDYWRTHLRPGGFGFSARITNYPDGKPGDIGLFLSWPKSSMEL